MVLCAGGLGADGWVPANDNFEHRTSRTETSAAAITFLTGATVEEGEPRHAGTLPTRSLWWSWTAPYTGQANFSFYDSSSEGVFWRLSVPSVAVYTGEVLSELSEVGSANLSGLVEPVFNEVSSARLSTDVNVIAGQTYQIAIADRFSPLGEPALVVLGINQPPTLISGHTVLGRAGSPLIYRIVGTNAPVWFTATDLPEGLLLNPFTGEISGTPHTPGLYDVLISAESSSGVGSATLRFDISEDQPEPQGPPEFTSGSPVVMGYLGQALNNTFWATHQPQSYTADDLPPGMIFGTGNGRLNGVPTLLARISGTPTETGIFVIPLTATNNEGTGQTVVTYNIRELRPPELTSGAAAYGKVGQTFSYTVNALASANPVTPTYAVGQLPPGLSVSSNNRTISGIPTEAGTFHVAVSASNAAGVSEAVLTIVITEVVAIVPVAAPLITSAASAQGIQSSSFSYQIQADNAPSVFTAENLPTGLSLNTATGLISGTPSDAGDYVSTISASNDLGMTSASLHIVIREADSPRIVGAASAVGRVGYPMSYLLELTNLAGSYYTNSASFTLSADNLPPGLSFTAENFWSSAVISGTPTQAGVYEVPLVGTANNKSTTAILTITIQEESPSSLPVITSQLGATAEVGMLFEFTLQSIGGPANYTVTHLPTGFLFDAGTARIRGVAQTPGIFPLSVTATHAGGTVSATIMLRVNEPQIPLITSRLSYRAFTGRNFNYFVGTAQNPFFLPTSFSESSSESYSATGLPPGLSLNSSSGQIHGASTVSGDFPVLLTARNPHGSRSVEVLFRVADDPPEPGSGPPIQVSSSTPLMITTVVGETLNRLVWPTGGATAVTAEGLPPGLTITPTSGTSNGVPTTAGRLEGVPTSPGIFPVTITFTDGYSSATAMITIRVDAVPQPPQLGTFLNLVRKATVGASFHYNVHSEFHDGPGELFVENLPPGLFLDAANGNISGTPTQTGIWVVKLQASNAGGVAEANLTIMVGEPLTPTLKPGLMGSAGAAGFVGVPFAFEISPQNLPTSLSVSGLPDGLVFHLIDRESFGIPWKSGKISGVPTAEGVYPVVITAANDTGTSTATVTISVRQAATVAPMFRVQPDNTQAVEGDPVAFLAEAIGIPAPTYQWLHEGGVALDGETSPSLHLPEVSREIHRTTYTARLTNSSGSVLSHAAMLEVLPRQISYASWAESHLLPLHKRGPMDDPSGAGVANLIAYALGLDPVSPAREKLPSATVEDNRLTLEYQIDKRANVISITPMWSSDLKEWTALGVQKFLVNDDFDTALWRAWVDIPDDAGFMRLEIVSP